MQCIFFHFLWIEESGDMSADPRFTYHNEKYPFVGERGPQEQEHVFTKKPLSDHSQDAYWFHKCPRFGHRGERLELHVSTRVGKWDEWDWDTWISPLLSILLQHNHDASEVRVQVLDIDTNGLYRYCKAGGFYSNDFASSDQRSTMVCVLSGEKYQSLTSHEQSELS